MRKIILMFAITFLTASLLRYSVMATNKDCRTEQYDSYRSEYFKRDDENSSWYDRKEESGREGFDGRYKSEYPQKSYDSSWFNKDWCNTGSFNVKSSSAKMTEIKDELKETEQKLITLRKKTEDEITMEINKTKSYINDVVKNYNLDLKAKKDKISKIKGELKLKVKKIENTAKKQAKLIVKQQNYKINLLLNRYR